VTDTSVLVIGGGFSGAMTAAHLAARGVATAVIEPGVLGRGVAYAATPYPLLLNTPAAAMSALPGAPQHFESWLEREVAHGTPRPEATPAGVFAPRALYGDYLEDTIAELARGRLDVIAARATALAPTARGFAVRCDDGREITTHRIVLALGNLPARTPDALDPATPGYLAEPYGRLAEIGLDEPVAILGSGLTALDVIAGLRARGHRGPIVCASRRGLVPTAHTAPATLAILVPRALVRQPRLRTLMVWWREAVDRVRDLCEAGAAEPAVIAALRPMLPTIWRRLPVADRAKFLRHVRPRWDVLRHRAPAAVRDVLDRGRAEGSVEVVAGQLVSAVRTAAGLRCQFGSSEGATLTRDVRWLINCTGPERDVRRLRMPLMQSLVAHRMLAPDPLGLGVLTGSAGQLIGEAGLVPDAFVVGPWRMADLFEASAVPELRHHAADTAMEIAGEARVQATG